jgi:hypothetical protein
MPFLESKWNLQDSISMRGRNNPLRFAGELMTKRRTNPGTNTIIAGSASWAETAVNENPLRGIAKGRPMFSVPIVKWSDDVSGSKSKQYNPHTNIYLANASLPHRKLAQEYFVRFATTSPHASSSELMAALSKITYVTSLFARLSCSNTSRSPDVWHEAFDCELEREVLFRFIVLVLPADNQPSAVRDCFAYGS